MTERFTPHNEPLQATPRNLAYAVLRRRGIESGETAQPKAGDVIIRDGEELMFVPDLRRTKRLIDGKLVEVRVPYTYRQYYSHSFEDPETDRWESAPGWDYKFSLCDDKVALLKHGRTFTREELKDLPDNLPTDDVLFLGKFGGYRVENYLAYLAQQKR